MPNSVDDPIFDPISEQAVMAATLRHPEYYSRLVDILKPEDFYWRPYGWLWTAFAELAGRGLEADVLTLAEELNRSGQLDEFSIPGSSFRGRAALSMIKDLETTQAAEAYALTVQDYAARRKLDRWLTEALTQAHQGGRATDIIHGLEARIGSLVLYSGRVWNHTANATVAAAQAYDASLTARKGNRVFPTGLRELDRILGIMKTELVTIAGRPGQGKSSLLQSITLNAAQAGKRVKFFSLEMGLIPVTQRFISQLCGIPAYRIMQGRLTPEEWVQYEAGRDKFCELPINICGLPAISIGQIRLEARRKEIDAVVLDYVQLVRAERRNDRRDLDIGEITMGLKTLAMELDIPVLQAAQMSRSVEARADRRPQLSDLRESGAIENDSDSVIFIHQKSETDPLELIVAKHRNGPVGTAEVRFDKECMRFRDRADKDFKHE